MNSLAAINLLEFIRLAVELAFLRVSKIVITLGMLLFVGVYFSDLTQPQNPTSVWVFLFFHLCTAGLIYLFANAIFYTSRVALGASLLFVFHPMTVQMITGQDGFHRMIACPLLMASLIFFTRFMDAGNKAGYFLSLGLFGLSIWLTPYAVGFLWVFIAFTAYFRGLRDPKRLMKIFAGHLLFGLGILFAWLLVLFPKAGPVHPAPDGRTVIEALSPIFTSVPFGLYPLLSGFPWGPELSFILFGLGMLVLFIKGWEDVKFLILSFFLVFLSWYPFESGHWVPNPFPVYLSGIFFSILLPLCLHKADIRLFKKFLKPTHFYTLSLVVLWASYAILLRWEFFPG